MKLIAIKLHGFKSFAQASHFPLESALTGIVGPNGCGKSNIIDAVRWVLGESAAKQLRGQSANDVIFAGTNERRPAQQAAVELIFAQGEERLAEFAAFEHISISRRIQRDGNSIYQINQKVVRRRDVVSLLHLMGVSARSYAVIEQGMIGRIIDAKPEELRDFIEEAAGIAIYKARRKESEQRLLDVEQHLKRHDERLQDLSLRKEKLAEEARVAQRFQDLNQQQHSLSHRLRSFQYHQLQLSIAQAEQEYSATETQLQQLEQSDSLQRLQSQQEALLAQKQAFQQAKQQHLQALQQQQQQHKQREQLQLRLEMNHQQQGETADIILQIEAESEEKSASLQEGQLHIQQLEQSIQSFGPQLLRLQQQHQQAQQQQQQQRLRQQQQQQQKQQQQAQQQRLQKEAQTLNQQIQQWQKRQSEQEALLQQPPPVATLNEDALNTAAAEVLLLAEQVQLREEALLQAQQKVQHQQEQQQKQQQIWEHARGQYEALQALFQREEGQLAHLPRVLNHLRIDERWQSALERHLGSLLQAAHSSQREDWQRAWAQQESLLGQGTIPPAWRDIIQGEVDLGWALEQLQPLPLRREEIQWEALQEGLYYLNLDGIVCSRDSLHVQNQESGHLAQWQRLQQLEQQLPDLEAAQKSALLALQDALQEQSVAQQALQQAQQQWQRAQQQQALLQQQWQLQEQALQHQALLQQQRQQQWDLLQQDLLQAQEQYQSIQEALLLLEEQLLLLEIDDEFLEEDWLQRAQQAWQEAEQQQQERQRQLVRLQTQREHQLEQLQRLQLERHKQQQKQEQWQREALQWQEQNALQEALLAECALQLNLHEEALQENEAAYEQAQIQFREAERLLENVQQQQRLLGERLQLQQAQIEQLQQQKDIYEVEFREMEIEPLRFQQDENVDTQNLQAQIRALKQALQSLGAVNLAAIDDYAHIEKEHQHWQLQCDDLRQSVHLLQQAIQQLDEETKKRLHETFTAVNQAFGEHIARLFAGGKGHLSWSSHDILQAGVVIHVALAGKKLRHLGALSGGEKALSALSLVFALFRLQPAPFCLLDEVDAPLDAANVQRLCLLLQEMSQHTQMVVITHHTQTMQHCERLMGVTMSELGVSRLVGVELNQKAL